MSRVLADLEPQPPTRSVVVHGDYWPGNAIWADGRLAAVIDWEDAALGDPLADLAAARLELLCAYGAAAMDTFKSAYLHEIGESGTDTDGVPSPPDTDRLSVWELCRPAPGHRCTCGGSRRTTKQHAVR